MITALFVLFLYLFATTLFFNKNLHKKTPRNNHPTLLILLQIVITILCPITMSVALHK